MLTCFYPFTNTVLLFTYMCVLMNADCLHLCNSFESVALKVFLFCIIHSIHTPVAILYYATNYSNLLIKIFWCKCVIVRSLFDRIILCHPKQRYFQVALQKVHDSLKERVLPDTGEFPNQPTFCQNQTLLVTHCELLFIPNISICRD